jgi:hypothetical protein
MGKWFRVYNSIILSFLFQNKDASKTPDQKPLVANEGQTEILLLFSITYPLSLCYCHLKVFAVSGKAWITNPRQLGDFESFTTPCLFTLNAKFNKV